MLDHAEEVARCEAFRQMSLITSTVNRAQRLYRRAGFEEVDRREDPAYERLTGVAGRILMAKSLAASNDPLQPTPAAQPSERREPAESSARH